MVTGLLIILGLIAISLLSRVHGIGLFLLILITHGILYRLLGKGSEHVPLYAGLAVMVVVLTRRQWKMPPLKILPIFLALLSIMGLSAITGINQQHSLVVLALYGRCMVLALLIMGCLEDEKDLKTISLYCLVGMSIGALAAAYTYKTGIPIGGELRAESLRGDPNETAMLLVAGVPLAVFWLSNAKKLLTKGLMTTLVVLLLLGLMLTFSRGGFVALSIVLIILYARRPSFKMAFLGLFLVTIVVAMAPQNYWDRMHTLVSGDKQGSSSLKDRARFQRVGLSIFMNHPLLGVGPGNYGQAFMQYSSRHVRTQMSNRNPFDDQYPAAHNMYLEFFVENGLIGGMLFLMLFCWATLYPLKYDKVHPSGLGLGFSIALSLGGMLLCGLFLSTGKNSVLWFITGVGFALGKIAESERKDELQRADSGRSPLEEVSSQVAFKK